MNVIKEIAEFSCTCVCHWADDGVPCDCHCLGTKREWPKLSDVCRWCKGKGERELGYPTKYEIDGTPTQGFWHKTGTEPCLDCTEGRTAAVMLEKITEIITNEGIHHYDVDYENDGIDVELVPTGRAGGEDDLPYGYGETLLEAFCAALIDFKKWKKHWNQAAFGHVEGCADYGQDYCNYCCITIAEKDKEIALKGIRIEELENQLYPKFNGKESLEELIEQRRKKNPPIMNFKVLSRFLGDAQVQCRCGNIFAYMQDEVMCRKCGTIFPMGLFSRD